MRYLLDTNTASYFIKATSRSLDYRVRRIPSTSIAISAITEAELRFGLALLPPEAKLHGLSESFLRNIVVEAWDSACAQRYARLAAQQRMKGESLSQPDTMIAAHAIAHGLTLVTHDRAFTRVPDLAVEDWTEGPTPA